MKPPLSGGGWEGAKKALTSILSCRGRGSQLVEKLEVLSA